MKTMIIILTLFFGSLAYAANDLSKEREACRSKLLAAQQKQIIYDLGFDSDTKQIVAVFDEPTWNSIDFSAKLGFAETVECFLLEPGQKIRRLEIRSNKTNKLLGIYGLGKLTVQ